MNNHKFFNNIECEYYPCHNMSNINCLFCYCPLYHMDDCEGSYIINEDGVKDCKECILPHSPINYDYIIKKLKG